MSANELLIWMSARMGGSWQQFRAAVEALQERSAENSNPSINDEDSSQDLPIYQTLRFSLQRLAHVEFTREELSWRTVPPVLAANNHEGSWIGILCGARSPVICKLIDDMTAPVERRCIAFAPDVIRFETSKREELLKISAALGAAVQVNAADTLLAALPAVGAPRHYAEEAPPSTPGWNIQQFSTGLLRWEQSEFREIARRNVGLFRFSQGFQRFHFLKWSGKTFRVPVQLGKYSVLSRRRRKRFIAYSGRLTIFSVPVICRPPLLIERALVLCSGFLPALNPTTGRLEYQNVPHNTARAAAALLRQEVSFI